MSPIVAINYLGPGSRRMAYRVTGFEVQWQTMRITKTSRKLQSLSMSFYCLRPQLLLRSNGKTKIDHWVGLRLSKKQTKKNYQSNAVILWLSCTRHKPEFVSNLSPVTKFLSKISAFNLAFLCFQLPLTVFFAHLSSISNWTKFTEYVVVLEECKIVSLRD